MKLRMVGVIRCVWGRSRGRGLIVIADRRWLVRPWPGLGLYLP